MHKGKYIAYAQRGARLIEAVEELLRIAREAGIPAEIYHLKAAERSNWSKMDQVIAMVEKARREGLKITADIFTYPAGATGLDAAMPPWVLDGGYEAAFKQLRDPETRKKIAEDPHAFGQMGEPAHRGRVARPRAARRLQKQGPEKIHRRQAGRSGEAAKRELHRTRS